VIGDLNLFEAQLDGEPYDVLDEGIHDTVILKAVLVVSINIKRLTIN